MKPLIIYICLHVYLYTVSRVENDIPQLYWQLLVFYALGISIWIPHTPRGRFKKHLTQGECEFQVDKLFWLSSEGLWVLNGVAHSWFYCKYIMNMSLHLSFGEAISKYFNNKLFLLYIFWEWFNWNLGSLLRHVKTFKVRGSHRIIISFCYYLLF